LSEPCVQQGSVPRDEQRDMHRGARHRRFASFTHRLPSVESRRFAALCGKPSAIGRGLRVRNDRVGLVLAVRPIQAGACAESCQKCRETHQKNNYNLDMAKPCTVF